MKNRYFKLIMLLLVLQVVTKVSMAQSAEAEQLLLNVEKLSQLRNILQDMKKGYTFVSNGYSAVKNIAQGNFSIHEVFIDGLMLVNPEIRKYGKVAEIVSEQASIVSEYKAALKSFKSSNLLNPDELDYISRVFANLFSQSVDRLDELTMVITASKLRMSDSERLKTIDSIFESTSDQLTFLRSFNRETGLLVRQRQEATADISKLNQLFKNP